MSDIIPQKCCTKCQRFFPATLEYFHACNSVKCGLQPKCKDCRASYNQTNADRMREYNQSYYEANRESILQSAQAYAETHKPQRAQYHKQYTESNRGVHRKACRKYDKSHPEQVRMHNMKHRARMKSIPGKHTTKDIQDQYERQQGKCYYCQKKLGTGRNAYHVDHIIPVNRGGTDNPDNLVIACQPCNSSKGDKLLHEWMKGGRLL